MRTLYYGVETLNVYHQTRSSGQRAQFDARFTSFLLVK